MYVKTSHTSQFIELCVLGKNIISNWNHQLSDGQSLIESVPFVEAARGTQLAKKTDELFMVCFGYVYVGTGSQAVCLYMLNFVYIMV